MTAWS